MHQILGKDLTAFDDGGVGPGAEAGDALFFQGVHTAQNQRIVGSHHCVVNGVFHGEGYDFVNLRSADGDTGGICGNAAVAGQGVDGFHLGIFLQGADDGVFPATAAYNQ